MSLKANTYRNDIIPRAQWSGTACILQDAEAYRDRVIADAEGEAARFRSAACRVSESTARDARPTLHRGSGSEVYGNSSKVIDRFTDGNGNLLYLPMDQLLRRSGVNHARSQVHQSPTRRRRFVTVNCQSTLRPSAIIARAEDPPMK